MPMYRCLWNLCLGFRLTKPCDRFVVAKDGCIYCIQPVYIYIYCIYSHLYIYQPGQVEELVSALALQRKRQSQVWSWMAPLLPPCGTTFIQFTFFFIHLGCPLVVGNNLLGLCCGQREFCKTFLYFIKPNILYLWLISNKNYSSHLISFFSWSPAACHSAHTHQLHTSSSTTDRRPLH